MGIRETKSRAGEDKMKTTQTIKDIEKEIRYVNKRIKIGASYHKAFFEMKKIKLQAKLQATKQTAEAVKKEVLEINLVPIIDKIEKRDLQNFTDDIHKRVYCLVDMRLFANSIVEELKQKIQEIKCP